MTVTGPVLPLLASRPRARSRTAEYPGIVNNVPAHHEKQHATGRMRPQAAKDRAAASRPPSAA
jgi:hypothetical protein